MTEPRTITIEIHGPNDFTVREGERFCDKLGWDEMLGQIAGMTHPKIREPRYDMLTEAEAQARHKWRADPDFREVGE